MTFENMRLKYLKDSNEELSKKAWETVNKGYGHVIDSMITKEGKHPKYAIIVDLIPEEKWNFAGQEESNPPYISVSYYNTRTVPLPKDPKAYINYEKDEEVIKYHKIIGFGLCPWSEYVDCDVIITPDAAVHLGSTNLIEKITSEILWEQTFHGFTEESVIDFVDELKSRIKGINSGKIKTKLLRKKKKGEKYDIRVPKDLLAPAKKKRSNKK